MDLNFVKDFFVPVVTVACLVVGYLVKNYVNDVNNKHIPTILCVLGAILNCVVAGTVTVELVVYGAVCGLASTGMHQIFKAFIEKGE